MLAASRTHRILALLLLVLLSGTASAVAVTDARTSIPLGPHYQVFEDATGQLGFADVVARADQFRPRDLGPEPNFGYAHSALWLRIPLATRDTAAQWLLAIPFPTLDDVRVFLRELPSGRQVAGYATGDRRPFAERPRPDVNFVFPLSLESGREYELYIRVRSEGSLTVAATLWTEPAYQADSRTRYVLASLYAGLLLGLLAYNFLLLLSLRDTTYLLYVLFTASMLLGQGGWNGYGYEYLWPDSPGWANLAALAGFNATGLFGALFSRAFLNTRIHAPWVDRFILTCAAGFALLLASVSFVPYQLHAMLTSAMALTFSLFAVFSGAICLLRGFVSARYFLLAWSLLLVGTASLGARNLDLIPTNFFTLNAMQIGSALEVLLLSFALAERINVVRHEKEAAEAAIRAKDEFLTTVSHEIRTPLTVLLGNVTLLLGSRLQPQQSVLAQSAKRSGEQLLSMLNDLIDLSRATSGQLHLTQTPFEAGTLVREVVELIQAPARDRGLSVKTRIGFDHMYVRGDPARVRQVLLNLAFNAVKFTEQGEIRVEATVIENDPQHVTLRFAVNDTGIGIAPADQERLFRPFSQVGATHARHGSGLGLAISRRLVEAMGGTIRVFSRLGQGSRFWFDISLPPCAEREAADQAPPVLTPPPLRLLLVDDLYESREVLAAQLRHAGHEVVSVESGEGALAAVEVQDFNAVLLDLHMPGLDGYATMERLRQRPAGCPPVFALTANVSTRTEQACLAAGMCGVVAKPLPMAELNARLVAVFGAGNAGATTPGSGTDGISLLDTGLLENRISLLGVKGTLKVLDAFLAVAGERLQAVLEAHGRGDHQAVARAAHALRGSAGAVGLGALLDLTDELERMAESRDPELAALVERLPEVLRQSQEALREWRAVNEQRQPVL